MNSPEFIAVSRSFHCHIADHMLQFIVLKDTRASDQTKNKYFIVSMHHLIRMNLKIKSNK